LKDVDNFARSVRRQVMNQYQYESIEPVLRAT